MQLGRTGKCGTIRLDFVLPERLDATYYRVGMARNTASVMLHRADIGNHSNVSIGHPDRKKHAGKAALPGWPLRQLSVPPSTSEADETRPRGRRQLLKVSTKASAPSGMFRNEKITTRSGEPFVAKCR